MTIFVYELQPDVYYIVHSPLVRHDCPSDWSVNDSLQSHLKLPLVFSQIWSHGLYSLHSSTSNSQNRPVKPSVHTQMSGLVHVPPFWQGAEQIAVKLSTRVYRIILISIVIIILHWCFTRIEKDFHLSKN